MMIMTTCESRVRNSATVFWSRFLDHALSALESSLSVTSICWSYISTSTQRWNRSRFPWPDPTGNPSVKPAGWGWPAKLQHLDQTLPRQTRKTAVYTTVRLHYVDKCQLSLHYHISIQPNENIACEFQPVMFVSFCTCATLHFTRAIDHAPVT